MKNNYQGMIHHYITGGVIPNNEKALAVAEKIKNCIDIAIADKRLPTMPDEKWMAERGTLAPPYDYEPTTTEDG